MTNDSKPVLMIHAMSDDMFELPLHEYTLTFDDGLYSQFQYLDRLLAIDTEKYFFISTNFVCTGKQNTTIISSSAAHEKARAGNKEDFMTAEQIQHISNQHMCHVGGHGHDHLRLGTIDRFVDRVSAAEQDLMIMCHHMQKLVGYVPTSFCFPYNYDIGGMYQAVLKKHGFVKWFGRERIPIEKLLHKPYP